MRERNKGRREEIGHLLGWEPNAKYDFMILNLFYFTKSTKFFLVQMFKGKEFGLVQEIYKQICRRIRLNIQTCFYILWASKYGR